MNKEEENIGPASTEADGLDVLTRLVDEYNDPRRREKLVAFWKKCADKVEAMEQRGDFDLKMSGYIPDSIFRRPFEIVK